MNAPKNTAQALLHAAINVGLTFSDCVAAYAAPPNDPYVERARNDCASQDDIEVDLPTVTSEADDGAWVLAWLRVDNTDIQPELNDRKE